MSNPKIKGREPVTTNNETTNPPLHKSGQAGDDAAVTNDSESIAQGSMSRQDSAAYINDMVKELKTLAENANFSFLAYLLELAIEESASHQRGRL